MYREERLKEARETLLQSYEAFWGRQKIPTKKVSMDLLLIDIIGQVLGLEDEKRDTLVNRSRFYNGEEGKENEDRGQGLLDAIRVATSGGDLSDDEARELDRVVPEWRDRVSPAGSGTTTVPQSNRKKGRV